MLPESNPPRRSDADTCRNHSVEGQAPEEQEVRPSDPELAPTGIAGPLARGIFARAVERPAPSRRHWILSTLFANFSIAREAAILMSWSSLSVSLEGTSCCVRLTGMVPFRAFPG